MGCVFHFVFLSTLTLFSFKIIPIPIRAFRGCGYDVQAIVGSLCIVAHLVLRIASSYARFAFVGVLTRAIYRFSGESPWATDGQMEKESNQNRKEDKKHYNLSEKRSIFLTQFAALSETIKSKTNKMS
jgi:hypothetical protein